MPDDIYQHGETSDKANEDAHYKGHQSEIPEESIEEIEYLESGSGFTKSKLDQLRSGLNPPSLTPPINNKSGVRNFRKTGKIEESTQSIIDVNMFTVNTPSDGRPTVSTPEVEPLQGPTGPRGSKGANGKQGRQGLQGPEGPGRTGPDLNVDDTGLTLYGYTLGIDPASTIAVAGVTATSIAATSITADIVYVDDQIKFANGMTAASIVTTVNGISGDVTLTDLVGVATFNGAAGGITTSSLNLAFAGISVGANGITFSNGTNLASASLSALSDTNLGIVGDNTFLSFSTSTAKWSATSNLVKSFNGAVGDVQGVSTFNGATGGITTSNLHLHVAGLSSDGGITFADGTHQSTAAGATNTDQNFTNADHTKLDGIEASADVTDTANVQAAVTSTHLHVAGVSSDAGATFGGDVYFGAGATFGNDIYMGGNYHFRNSAGNSVIDFEGDRNLKLGDNDSAGNDTTIHIRDSHTSIILNADGAITLSTPIVYIDGELRHSGDVDTKLSFPSANNLVLTAGGVTFAHGTASGLYLPAGLSADAGATFGSTVTAPTFVGALTGNVTGNASGTAATVTTAAQGNITSVGTLTALTMGGELSCVDNLVTRPKLKDYAETVNAIGTVTSDTAVDVADGNVQTVTVGGDCKFSFTNFPASGIAGTVTLIITNGGAHTTTWQNHGSQSVKWPGDNAPALTSSGVDIISFLTIDAGVLTYGFVGGINFS